MRFEKDDSFTLHPYIMRFLFASDLKQSGFGKTEERTMENTLHDARRFRRREKERERENNSIITVYV